MKRRPKTILIDSSNLLHRAVWITENTKTQLNPAYIFLTSVKKYAEMFHCRDIYSVWDKKLVQESTNYRTESAEVDYKGGRDRERSERVYSYEEVTSSMLSTLGVKNIYPGVLEADDVISWLAEKIPHEKVIVSVDQDMLQLIDKKTYVYSPIKDVIIDLMNFEQKVGVELSHFLRYKSLMGDKSDNLPGIDRCGPKTAARLVRDCSTDVELIEKLGEATLKPYFHNLEMIDLKKGHEYHPEDPIIYDEQYIKLQKHAPDMDKFRKLAGKLNMKRIETDYSKWSSVFGHEQLTKTLEDIVNSLGLSK